MEDQDRLDDIRFLRNVVDRTLAPAVNRYWPVTLSWGVIVTIGYAACAFLAMTDRTKIIPWVMPILVFLVGWPLHFFLRHKVRQTMDRDGRRPQYRRDVMLLWTGITVMGLLATAWLIASGTIADHWFLIPFIWCALNFVGYLMNGALVSTEWFWAAGALLASMIATGIAGPQFYWISVVWIPATFLLPGVMGYRNARRQTVEA